MNATSVLLEPLGPEETDRLIESLAHLDEPLRDRILEAAEGNPLFVEEMVAWCRSRRAARSSSRRRSRRCSRPASTSSSGPERDVLERGAVEGRIFHRGAVQALAPDEAADDRAAGVARPQGARSPRRASSPGEDAFRFRHLLIRDAAYDALPKSTRAELHERFATWLEEHGRDMVELDEILGYHLEQAYRYGAELGHPDEGLGLRAAERLSSAGQRAYLRGDVGGTITLLQRALALQPVTDIALEAELADALMWGGRTAEAEALVMEVEARAASAGDRLAGLLAGLLRSRVMFNTDPEGRADELMALAQEAIPLFEEAEDEVGLMHAWWAIAFAEHMHCRFEARNRAHEAARDHALRAGDERVARFMQMMLGAGLVFGPFPVAKGLRWFEAHESLASSMPALLVQRGMLVAFDGRLDEARELLLAAQVRMRELGQRMVEGHLGEGWWYVEMHGGDPEVAERALRAAGEVSRRPLRGLALDPGGRARSHPLRARSLRRGRRVGCTQPRARRERRRDHADAVAPGRGQGSRSPWVVRRG